MNNSVNFRAKLLNPVKIQRYNPETDKYNNSEASFIEIKPKCKSDIKAMQELVNDWYDAQYAHSIYDDMLEMGNQKPEIKSRFFAVTTQNEQLNRLDSSKILGITELSLNNKKEPLIKFIQVSPEIVEPLLKASFKHVGTEILNSLKKIYNSLTSYSSLSYPDFYLKNGFELINDVLFRFRWVKK